jgi:hypothetical protein
MGRANQAVRLTSNDFKSFLTVTLLFLVGCSAPDPSALPTGVYRLSRSGFVEEIRILDCRTYVHVFGQTGAMLAADTGLYRVRRDSDGLRIVFDGFTFDPRASSRRGTFDTYVSFSITGILQIVSNADENSYFRRLGNYKCEENEQKRRVCCPVVAASFRASRVLHSLSGDPASGEFTTFSDLAVDPRFAVSQGLGVHAVVMGPEMMSQSLRISIAQIEAVAS